MLEFPQSLFLIFHLCGHNRFWLKKVDPLTLDPLVTGHYLPFPHKKCHYPVML